jgi:hypothetical protein
MEKQTTIQDFEKIEIEAEELVEIPKTKQS